MITLPLGKKVIVFYFLDYGKVASARISYKDLKTIDYEPGDRFFETYGPGMYVDLNLYPFEVYNDYRNLLRVLHFDDINKYKNLHKGTPFYFMGWASFRMGNYEDAVFYMDTAISEDERKISSRKFEEWIRDPGGQFLTLEEADTQVAREMTLKLRSLIEKEFSRFNSISGLSLININNFREQFVLVLAKDKKTRSIITALYSFIFEFFDRYQMLALRSKLGGSIEPMLTHLFKGGLVFESILKKLYPEAQTLGDFNKIERFVKDFCKIETQAVSLKSILQAITNNNVQIAFNTTVKLRNTSGHSLVWDDIFNDPENYEKLYQQIINAIFFVIAKKYLLTNIHNAL